MRLFKLYIVICLGLLISSCALVPGGDIYLSEADRKISEQTPSITVEQIEFSKITAQNTKRKYTKLHEPHRNLGLEQQVKNYTYKIGAGDVLKVIVWEHPELLNLGTQDAAIPVSGFDVDSKGYIFYPYVGRFHVEGQSVFALQVSLSEALSKFIESPQLSVTVVGFASKKIYLTGQFVKPAPIVMGKQAITLFDAVIRAGGLKTTADLDNIVVIRDGARRHVDLFSMVQFGDMRENMLLKDGDQIHVAAQKPKYVHVMGQVGVPISIPMTAEGVSLAQALAAARGINEITANAAAIYVIRESHIIGKVAKIHMLDLSNMAAMVLAAKFELQNEDVVYIAKAPIVKWNQLLSIVKPSLGVPGSLNSVKASVQNILK